MKKITIVDGRPYVVVKRGNRPLGTKLFGYTDLNLFQFVFYPERKQREALLKKAHEWADTLLNQSYKYEENVDDL